MCEGISGPDDQVPNEEQSRPGWKGAIVAVEWKIIMLGQAITTSVGQDHKAHVVVVFEHNPQQSVGFYGT